jgi:hypothetical protein
LPYAHAIAMTNRTTEATDGTNPCNPDSDSDSLGLVTGGGDPYLRDSIEKANEHRPAGQLPRQLQHRRLVAGLQRRRHEFRRLGGVREVLRREWHDTCTP